MGAGCRGRRSALFNICIGQFSGDGAFGPLVIIRLVQVVVISLLIVAVAPAVADAGDVLPSWSLIGLLDMTGNAAFILATQAGQLAIAAVLSSLYPVVTVLLAIVDPARAPDPSHVVGIVLTAVAIVLIAAGQRP